MDIYFLTGSIFLTSAGLCVGFTFGLLYERQRTHREIHRIMAELRARVAADGVTERNQDDAKTNQERMRAHKAGLL